MAATDGPGLPAVAVTDHPGTCPACAVTRWQRVTATIATVGWRTVRNHLADLGNTTAQDETSHDCTQPGGKLNLADDNRWGPGQALNRLDNSRPAPLFCAIDRHGTPQVAYPLSTRSITTIIANRLTTAAHTDRRRPAVADDDADTASAWGSSDHARALAARHVATQRLANFEADLDEADAYAEAILTRLNIALGGGPP